VPVAIKVITGERAEHPYFRASFHNEVRAVASLEHPAIVRVLDHGEVGPHGAAGLAPGSPYLVMERASGGTLRAAEQRALAWPEIRTILLALLGALAHAHARGIIHRDLKPGNVLVCGRDDPRPGLKLTDFGLARLLEDHEGAGTVEAVRGTLHYLSPEQARGLWRDQGPWTDLYALGCIAWQLATGRPPFGGFQGDDLLRAHVAEPLPAFPPRRGLPAGYPDWVASLLAKRPWDRPQRAADAAWALSRLGEPEDVGPTRWIFEDLAAAHGLSADLDSDPTSRAPLADGPDDAPTVRADALPDHPAGSPDRAAPSRDHPPIPRTWRAPQAPPPDLRLLDAGLSVLGLRTLDVVGRNAERDALWSALRRVDALGEPAAVVLRGPKGSGISRLSSWMASRAHEVGAAHVFLLTHRPGEPAVLAVRRALARAIGTSGLDDADLERRIRAFATRWDLAHLVPVLTPALGSACPLDLAAVEPLHGALLDVMGRFAEDRPVVLRVEDLHRCPDDGALVLALLDRPIRALAVVTRRDDGDGDAPHPLVRRVEARATVLTPGPMSVAEVSSLLRGQLRLTAPLSLQVEQLVRGNPLFAVQLALGWAERGVLVPTPEGFTLRDGVPVQLPDDLHAAWAQRVDTALARLPARCRVDLERAAILGERFAPHLWHAACDPGGRTERERLVEVLLDGRALVRDGSDLAFAHPMLRESLVRAAREAGRARAHHAACAEAVAATPGSGWRRARRLGMHRLQAGDLAGAVGPLLDAAEGAAAEGDPRTSLALAATVAEGAAALPSGDPAAVRAAILRLQGHAACGEFAEADRVDAALAASVERVEDPLARGALLLALAHHAARRERADAATIRLDAARAAFARTADARAPARAAHAHTLALVEAWIARLRGDRAAAEAAFDQAISAARASGDRIGQAVALRGLGALRWHAGEAAAAEVAYRAALDLLPGGHPGERAALLNNLGECARGAGDLEAAEAAYRAAADLAERAGAASFPYPLLNLGIIRVRQGHHHEALEPLARALEELERQGNDDLAAATRLALLPCCAALGDWPGWTQQLDRLDRSGLPTLVEPELGDALRQAAETAFAAGRPAEARRGFALAADVLARVDRPDDAAACRGRAEVLGAPSGSGEDEP
jgi:serine/threonine protein kinase/tetratricopeptide (TPR) repeat protein